MPAHLAEPGPRHFEPAAELYRSGDLQIHIDRGVALDIELSRSDS
ncbi:hypothetical protein OAM92_00355 [Acidimicrobiales bacterium]|nr:hypothetical protein [Acidimicrobiales bacterium]